MIGRTNAIGSGITSIIYLIAGDFIGISANCTNGSTFNKNIVVGSDGTATFNVKDTGTYTLSVTKSGKTYSQTIEIDKINYFYEVSIIEDVTLNLTVYSAANDTVYYYDANNDKTTLCTTNSSGSGTATLVVTPNTEITFYSTVAKDTTATSSPFSKKVNLTKGMTTISVMPDMTLYWYGYKVSFKTLTNSKSGNSTCSVSFGTNAASFYVGKQYDTVWYYAQIVTNSAVDLTPYKFIKAVKTGTGGIGIATSATTVSTGSNSYDVSSITGSRYVGYGLGDSAGGSWHEVSGTLKALWLE